jgi:hypothetical protein
MVPEPFAKLWVIYPHPDGSLPIDPEFGFMHIRL